MVIVVPQASLEPCWACGEVIKDHVIRALERAYHPPCFVCTTCKQPIGEQRFAQGEVGEVYCLQDYYRYITAAPQQLYNNHVCYTSQHTHLIRCLKFAPYFVLTLETPSISAKSMTEIVTMSVIVLYFLAT